MENKLEYIQKETIISVAICKIKKSLFRLITKDTQNIFLKGGDEISIAPQIQGVHEKAVTTYLRYIAESGQSDFLLDIGANIGLSSCQSGKFFKKIHMFEPNPLCLKILEVNAQLAIPNIEYTIHPYGLGAKNERLKLTVPTSNWGGAFIENECNSYSSNILRGKDLSDEQYFNVEIDVKRTESALTEIFQSLDADGLNDGVVKIDVEGYEFEIIKGIANVLPKNMRVVIVFESLDDNLDPSKIENLFGFGTRLQKISRTAPWTRKLSMRDRVRLLFSGGVEYKLKPACRGNMAGDLVLTVN